MGYARMRTSVVDMTPVTMDNTCCMFITGVCPAAPVRAMLMSSGLRWDVFPGKKGVFLLQSVFMPCELWFRMDYEHPLQPQFLQIP